MTMKTRILVLSLLVSVTVGGCKTTQMAWWKSSKSSESTAIAHTAPVSPAEAAKQELQQQATSEADKLVGGNAAPFVPGAAAASSTVPPAAPTEVAATPTAYPKTSAPAYSPSQVAAAMGDGGTAADKVANSPSLGSLPYDPNRVPVGNAPTDAVAESVPQGGAARYGTASPYDYRFAQNSPPPAAPPAPGAGPPSVATNQAPSYRPTPPPGPSPQEFAGISSSSANRYGPASPSVTATPPATNDVPGTGAVPTGQPGKIDLVNNNNAPRYAPPADFTPPADFHSPSTTEVPAAGAAEGDVQVASAAEYRPGGTSSYPSAIGVASAPESPGTGAAQDAGASPWPAGRYR